MGNRNFRIYLIGQSVSLLGSWMLNMALMWLVLTLTGSAADLGWFVALIATPLLLLAPYSGLIVDRSDRLRLMVLAQGVMCVMSIALGMVTLLGVVQLWQVCLFTIPYGIASAFEGTARQAFLREMLDDHDDLRNAVSLNSVAANVMRIAGPGVAGLIISSAGIGICILIDGVSFIASIAALLVVKRSHRRVGCPEPRSKGQLRESLRYSAKVPAIGLPLAMMGLVGLLAYEFPVSIPVLVRGAFNGGSEAYGTMSSLMGLGAVIGGLITAAWSRASVTYLALVSTGFGVAILATAFAPNFTVACVAVLFTGWGSVAFSTVSSATIQVAAEPRMQGRVISLWRMAYEGSSLIGAPLIGWIAATIQPRAGLATGGLACFVAAVGGYLVFKLRRDERPPGQHDCANNRADPSI